MSRVPKKGSYPFSARAISEKGCDPFFRTAILLIPLLTASCGAPLMKLPSGPATPASDASAALIEATATCRTVNTITAEIAVSGSVGGRGLRARLVAGLASPASARLEAAAPFGQPVFIFVARGNDATLLLPRDGRVLEHGRPEAVLEAIAAVPLDAAALRVVLTGCTSAPDLASARQIGDDWRVVPDGPREVYLHREARGMPWRLVAVVNREADATTWRGEYRGFGTAGAVNGLPQTVRLASVGANRFDLRLTLSQVAINETLDAAAFTVQIPAGTAPITLAELKNSGPLGR
jgi:hypothetical protein